MFRFQFNDTILHWEKQLVHIDSLGWVWLLSPDVHELSGQLTQLLQIFRSMTHIFVKSAEIKITIYPSACYSIYCTIPLRSVGSNLHSGIAVSWKFVLFSIHITLLREDIYTERIACILCMHLGACRFFMHTTALMHLKKWILRKCIQLHFIFFAPRYTNGISLRIIIKDYIITLSLVNETALNLLL